MLVAWIGAGAAILVFSTAVLPRWWAHRVGDQADGSMVQGVAVGLFYGFVFTALPVLLLWWGLRRARRWGSRLALVATALVLALPNLLTLGIVLGRGDAAHAGERTFDVEAPGFRGATLIGAVAGVAALVALAAMLRSRRRARERVDTLEEELRSREQSAGD
jgi:hypothetical protein